LEVLAVVVIIVTVAAMIGVRFYRSLDSAALRSASHRMLQTARYARLIAGQNHQACTLVIDLDRQQYWLQPKGGPARPGVPTHDENAEQVTKGPRANPKQLPDPVRVRRVEVAGKGQSTQGQVEINFHVDGSADGALVLLGAAQQTRTLVVYPWTAQAQLKAGSIEKLPIDTVDLSEASPSGRLVP